MKKQNRKEVQKKNASRGKYYLKGVLISILTGTFFNLLLFFLKGLQIFIQGLILFIDFEFLNKLSAFLFPAILISSDLEMLLRPKFLDYINIILIPILLYSLIGIISSWIVKKFKFKNKK